MQHRKPNLWAPPVNLDCPVALASLSVTDREAARFPSAVNLAGHDNVFYYFDAGRICNFDGTTRAQGHRNP